MQKNRKALYLLVAGLLVITGAQISAHYWMLSDVVNGVFIGVGIGLLCIAILFGSRRSAIG
jgi:hypothetical protein